jgi:arsenite methyltransferase
MTKYFGFLLAAAVSAVPQTAHQHHPPRSAQEYARALEDRARAEWQKPDEVVRALGLKKTDVVADLGAGTGYFARRFAPLVAKVYAVDIDAGLLEICRRNAPPNLETVLAAPDDPRLPSGSVDLIFICDVLHHIEGRTAYLPKLTRALKPGGRVVNIDFFKKPLPVGPPVEMKLNEEEVAAEFKAAGLRQVAAEKFLPYQYFLIFGE